MYFTDFDFEDEVLDALDAMRFEKCTPIQEQTPEQEPEATSTKGSKDSTENTEAIPPEPTEDTEIPIVED